LSLACCLEETEREPAWLPQFCKDEMSDEAKEWLGFAVLLAGAATIVASISVLFGRDGFSTFLLYAAVGLTAVSASAVGGALLHPKWKRAPVVWYVVYFFIILPACVAVGFGVLDSIVQR